ncbi:MAG: sugar transferase [Planctomycetota bacterium]
MISPIHPSLPGQDTAENPAAAAPPAVAPAADGPTVWGLDAAQLHDRFWAARGVQVVCLGEPSELIDNAELLLLTDRNSLSIFRLGQLIDTVSWLKPKVQFVRLHNARGRGYSERVITDDEDRFLRFERVYSAPDWRLGRVALTSSRELARSWQQATDVRTAWRQLRRSIPPNQRTTLSVGGYVYDRHDRDQVAAFTRELVSIWKRPDATIQRVTRLDDQVWGDVDSTRGPGTRFIGPVWVGAGRSLRDADLVVGPAVLWDAPDQRPAVEALRWKQISITDVLSKPVKVRRVTLTQRRLKRLFDLGFASVALLMTLPIYPLVMLAILIEDGRPFFFPHLRECRGGREFLCLKFRTMRKDAEQIKQQLEAQNQADGPQFFMEDDPRISRVGRVLRKFNLDELPQFLNVIAGQMAIVGPRPSPYKENQYCPGWREARLSVRPGVTGLWQVKRSRQPGKDFQEWIRYDIEYVENMSWKLDFYIIGQTLKTFFRFRRPRPEQPEN